jgi:hypothetical protein
MFDNTFVANEVGPADTRFACLQSGTPILALKVSNQHINSAAACASVGVASLPSWTPKTLLTTAMRFVEISLPEEKGFAPTPCFRMTLSWDAQHGPLKSRKWLFVRSTTRAVVHLQRLGDGVLQSSSGDTRLRELAEGMRED